MSAPNAGPTCPGPALPIETSPYLGNASRTYLFNLIRLTRNRETFDIIYLDGSHSIYVDLAVAVAAIRLLSPGALFLFDDVRFSLGRRRLIPTTTQYAVPMRPSS